jgi:hypothetical protein
MLSAAIMLALALLYKNFGSQGVSSFSVDNYASNQVSGRREGGRSSDTYVRGRAKKQAAVRVCSQNLFRFGSEKFSRNKQKREKQKTFLVSRMKRAACDVIGVQEVSGESRWRAKGILQELADSLGERSGRKFSAHVGDSQDKYIRNGFIVADDLGKVVGFKSYWRESLPRIQKRGRPRSFVRGPVSLEVVLAQPRFGIERLLLFSVHLKSKSNSWKDPTKTDFEVYRMESAQAVRRIALDAFAKRPKGTMLMLMGDRNSEESSASADVLEGRYLIADFHKDCKLREKTEVDCVSQPNHRPELVGLFEARKQSDPQRYRKGSYRYKRRDTLIDEIYVLPEKLSMFRGENASWRIGFEGDYYKGSDHLLLWAEITADRHG